jgi:hypothetical protein
MINEYEETLAQKRRNGVSEQTIEKVTTKDYRL